jgi:hypothetical protein
MQCAAAYLFNGKVVIVPESQTTAGVWITGEPVGSFRPEDATSLGQALLSALRASKQSVPHPTDWTGHFQPVLKAAAAKSRKSFMASAKHVAVEMEAGRLTLRPSRNLGPRAGFEGCKEARAADAEVPEMAGEALILAFRDAE